MPDDELTVESLYGARFSRERAGHLALLGLLPETGHYADDRAPAEGE